MDVMVAERLGIRGRGAWRVRGIDLSVRPGERVALLGPPGSGKSSLLRCAAGLLPASEGGVRVLGEPVPRSRRRTALLAELGGLDPALTPAEHLEFVARARGLARSGRMGEVMGILGRLRLTDVRDVPVRSLSQGQRRAVAVAAALLPPVPLLLLDDPFSSLDPMAASALDEMLHDRQTADKVAVLFATRRPAEAAGAQTVVLLREGRLLACDSPSALCSAIGPETIIVRPLDDTLSARRLEDALGVKVYREAEGYRLVVERAEPVLDDLMRGFAPAIRAVFVRQASLEKVYQRYFGETPG